MSDDKKKVSNKSKYQIAMVFDTNLAEEILRRMRGGEDLRSICNDKHMPRIRGVAQWRKKDKEFNKLFLDAFHQGLRVGTKRNIGRPSIRTPEIEEEIIARLEDGEILAQICRLEHMPRPSAVYDWMALDPILSNRIARAKALGTQAIVADCLDIADDGRNDYYEKVGKNGEVFIALDSENIQRSRLRIDTRKYLMGTIDPSMKDNSQQTNVNILSSQINNNTAPQPEAETTQQAYEEYQKLIKGE